MLPPEEIEVDPHEINVADATDLPYDNESFHAIVTDPPYFLGENLTIDTVELLEKGGNKKGSGFMSKSWDGGEVEVVESESVPEELL